MLGSKGKILRVRLDDNLATALERLKSERYMNVSALAEQLWATPGSDRRGGVNSIGG